MTKHLEGIFLNGKFQNLKQITVSYISEENFRREFFDHWLNFFLIFTSYLPFPFFCFLKCIYFIWRIITLQYCDGFCHTSTSVGHGLYFYHFSYSPNPKMLNLFFFFCYLNRHFFSFEIL